MIYRLIRKLLLRNSEPYNHLYGYMMRWWVVPYRRVVERHVPADHFGEAYTTTDGTGPVSFWRRPIAWVFQRFDIAIRVHDIMRSDSDQNPHDHPWPYLTVILSGGYWEHRYDAAGHHLSCMWHGPGSVLYRPAHWWHRLELPPGQACATLFITRGYVHGWGFNVKGHKVPWRDYLNGASVRPTAATPSAAPDTDSDSPAPPARVGR